MVEKVKHDGASGLAKEQQCLFSGSRVEYG